MTLGNNNKASLNLLHRHFQIPLTLPTLWTLPTPQTILSVGSDRQSSHQLAIVELCEPMSGENRQLVADEPVEFEK